MIDVLIVKRNWIAKIIDFKALKMCLLKSQNFEIQFTLGITKFLSKIESR
jgi:hypothetical protein